MVKKFLLTLILFFLTISNFCSAKTTTGFVDYQEQNTNSKKTETLLVLPIDFGYFNTYKSTYSSILNTISGDIINTTNKTSQLRAMPLYNLNYKIKQNKLEPEFKKVIVNYKSKSIIDYRALRTMCDILHTDKALLISGDFDPSQFIFKPNSSIEAIPAAMIKPSYQINALITLVDPQEEEILWERIYKKSFTIDSPQTDFEHNAISLKGMMGFSQAVSKSVLRNVSDVLITPEPVTSVDSYVINTTIRPTEGVTTKDGHSFSTVNKFVKTTVKTTKKKYYDWADGNL